MSERRNFAEFVALLARLVLGAVFIVMGLEKALHPVDFLKLLRQYDLGSEPILLNSLAGLLPWFEIFCGMLLCLGIAVRGVALVMLALLVPFTLLVLRRGLALASASHLALCAVKFDCGCGGGEVLLCRKLVENTALSLAALWLSMNSCHRFCVRHTLIATAPTPEVL